MSQFDRHQQGKQYEGYAFTFCKAAFLVLIFRGYSLLALSGLAALFYLLAAERGVTESRCWLKHPYVTLWWSLVFLWQLSLLIHGHSPLIPGDSLSFPVLLKH